MLEVSFSESFALTELFGDFYGVMVQEREKLFVKRLLKDNYNRSVLNKKHKKRLIYNNKER